MQLFVRSEMGSTVVVSVDSSITIAAVASASALKTGALRHVTGLLALLLNDPDDCYLSYGGVPLRSERTLEEYGIQNHATLDYCNRKRGGCFAFSITLWIIIFLCFLLSICTCGLSLPVALALIPIALVLPLCCL